MADLRKPRGDGGSMKEPLVIELFIISLIVILFLLIGVVLINRLYVVAVVIQNFLDVEQHKIVKTFELFKTFQ